MTAAIRQATALDIDACHGIIAACMAGAKCVVSILVSCKQFVPVRWAAIHFAGHLDLYDYVCEWWDDGLDEQVGKLDSLSRSEAIEGYFDAHADALDAEGFAIE